AWPAFIAFDKQAVEALIHVGLLDRSGRVPAKAWRGWFDPARERRQCSRDRWARYNAKRDVSTALEPRGSDVSTATSVRPSVRSFRPSVRKGERDSTPVETERARLVDPVNA